MSLSLVVIAKDEADRIGACLASADFADEIVVLDSGSSDRTVEVAQAHGARVVRTDWPGYVAQKNRALAEARADWVLSLDADERLSTRAAAEVRRMLADPGSWCGFSFPRCTRFRGRELRHGRSYPDRKLRLALRDRARWVGHDPHDRLTVDGPVQALAGDLLHDPYRGLDAHLRKSVRYAEISAHSLGQAGVRGHWWDVAARPVARFADDYVLRGGFLDGGPGLVVAAISAGHTAYKWSLLRKRDGR